MKIDWLILIRIHGWWVGNSRAEQRVVAVVVVVVTQLNSCIVMCRTLLFGSQNTVVYTHIHGTEEKKREQKNSVNMY